MNKIASLIVLLSFIISSLVFTVPGKGATHGYQLGDANDDGYINMKDVLHIRRYIALIERERDINLLSADVDKDNAVTMKDVLDIRRVIAGIENFEDNNSDDAFRVGQIKISGKNISRG